MLPRHSNGKPAIFRISITGCRRVHSFYLQLFYCLLLLCSIGGQAQIITTIAGNGTSGYTGDGGPAIAAELALGVNLAIDNTGNLFISDAGVHCIRKVNIYGSITTFAGTGTSGFSGDSGPASAAQFKTPTAIAFDGAGNAYVSDGNNYRIRKINSSGIITTIAGTGTAGYNGDNIAATLARINGVTGMCVDATGNLYIVDRFNNRVRKISTAGIISTFAGTGVSGFTNDGFAATTAKLNSPYGIAIDGTGNLYINDAGNNRIRKVDVSGIITTVVGTGTSGIAGDGGPATSAQLPGVVFLGTDVVGSLYLSCNTGMKVRKVDAASGIINTIAGTGTAGYNGDYISATTAQLFNPGGVVVDGAGDVYLGDYSNHRVRLIQYGNRPPSFDSGLSTHFTTCADTLPVSIDTLLAVTDSDHWQLETWTTVAAPLHGTLVTSVSATSPGFSIVPHGNTYKPAYGYTGPDTFKARVSDGQVADTITVYVTINPSPGPITGTAVLCMGGVTTLSTTSTGGLWSSSNTATATIGSTSGIATSAAAGTLRISYSYTGNGCSSRLTLTVNPLPAPITGTASVCVGLATTLSDTTTGGTWSSATTGVSIAAGSINAFVTGVLAGTTTITYTLPTGCKATRQFTVNPTPSSITGNRTICTGLTSTLSSATTGGVWTSANTAVATIGSSGVITALAAGTSVVSYTLSTGCAAVTTVTVNASPSAIVGLTGICFGNTATLSNTGGSWSSSNTTVAAIGSSSGIITTSTAGTSVLTYAYSNGCFVTATATVLPVPAAITGPNNVCPGLTVTLSNPSGSGAWASTNTSVAAIGTGTGIVTGASAGTTIISYSFLSSGCAATMAFTVNPVSATISGVRNICNGATTSLSNFISGGTWSSSSSAVSISGSTGLITGTSSATAPITYTLPSGCMAFTTVTVAPLPTTISGSSSVCTGGTETLSDGIAGGAWSSSNTSIATIGSANGVVSGVSSGIALITYTLPPGCATTTTITVNPQPAPITGPVSVCIGQTATLSCATAGGVWSSPGYAGIATVGSATGIVSGTAAGTAVVSYALPAGCASTTTVTVNPVAPITGNTTFCFGGVSTLSVAIAGGTWSSSNANVVPGSVWGVIVGVSAGSSTITYTTPAGCIITTTAAVYSYGTLTPAIPNVCVGGMGSLYNPTGAGTWSTASTMIAAVTTGTATGTGVVTGLSSGTYRITYTLIGGCQVYWAATVNPLPTVIAGATTLCTGTTTTLHSFGGSTWSASNTAVATIGSTGIVTGVSPGTSGITYTTSAGCTQTTTVTVTSGPGAIYGTSVVCTGTPATLSAGTGGGVWTISGSAVCLTLAGGACAVSGLAIGSAILTYSTGTGCISTKALTVQQVQPVTGNTTICNGLTTSLSCATAGGTWSTGSSSIASVGSSSGIVTGIAAGTAPIVYTAPSGCTATTTVTVNAQPPVITGTTGMCAGQTTTLSDPTAGGTWSSGGTGIASIGTVSGIVNGIAAGTAVITYSMGAGCYVTTTVAVSAAPTINGASAICTGATTTLSTGTVAGTWNVAGAAVSLVPISSAAASVTGITAGTDLVTFTTTRGCTAIRAITVNPLPQPIGAVPAVCVGNVISLSSATAGGTWVSNNPLVAAVGLTSGAVSGLAAGSSLITYTLNTGCATVTTVAVVPPPPSITGPMRVCQGESVTMSNTISGGTWIVDPSSAGSAVIGSATGIVSGISAGTAVISYMSPSSAACAAIATATVDPLPSSISAGPAACMGVTTTISDADAGGTWASSTPATIAVYPAGIGSATCIGLGMGSADITYTLATGCYTTITQTVNVLPPAITGPTTVCSGSTATLSDILTGGSWSSDNTAIATAGLTTGVITGGPVATTSTATISYLYNGCPATRPITVNRQPAPITGADSICAWGSALRVYDADTPSGTWNSYLVGVDTTGLVTSFAPGVGTISYTLPTGCFTTTTIQVNALPGAITGPAYVCLGGTITLTDFSGGGVWSTASGLASIDPATGIVTGISGGTATFSYTTVAGGCISTKDVAVDPQPLPISGAVLVCEGATATLSDGTPGGVWSSTGGASIGTLAGVVTGLTPGTATIYYSVTNLCGTAIVSRTMAIHALPDAGSITGMEVICRGTSATLSASAAGGFWAISNASATMTVIDPVTVAATGMTGGVDTITYSVANMCGIATVTHTVSITLPPAASPIVGADSLCIGAQTTMSHAISGGAWSSGAATIAAIDPSNGTVSGLAAGVAVVRYTYSNSCGSTAVTHTITVNPLPYAGIISAPVRICAGSSATLSENLSGGIWSSGSLASLTPSGTAALLTGNTSGTDTIAYAVTNTCGTSYATATVIIGPLPDAGTITGADSICAGDTAFLQNVLPGGTWLNSSAVIADMPMVIGSTALTVGASSGIDTIRYIVVDNYGCTNGAVFPLVVKTDAACAAATADLSGSGCSGNVGIHVFPNPSPEGEYSVILYSGFSEPVNVAVFDIAGQRLFTTSANTNGAFDVKPLIDQHVYILLATTSHGRCVQKLIK